jgi:phage tail sheath protein FI
LLVRSGNDNNAQKNILETWTNLSMDVNEPNYIARVLGNTKPVYTYSATDGQGYIDYTGDFANASRYVRVASVAQAQHNTFNNNGVYLAAQYSASLPNPGSGSVGGAFNGGVVDTSLSRFMFEAIISGVSNAQGFTTANYAPALNLLNNTDEYAFNLLLTPGLFLAGGNSSINIGANGADPIALAQSRADSLAVVDTVPYGGTITSAATAANASNSSYGATYWPWCQVFSSAMGKLVWVPASVVMGGVFAFTDEVSAPWFAPAGLTRGTIPNVIKVERKLSLNDRNTLYTDNVNPLATFPGQGVVVFGQKTLQQKASALDRVNVRRLLIALKNYIGSVGRGLVFEQNTAVTRNKFLNQVNPYLDNVVQRQGLFAYKVVMDESINTPDVVDRNQLIGQIYIQPTKTAEFVILDFTVLPTGVEFPA